MHHSLSLLTTTQRLKQASLATKGDRKKIICWPDPSWGWTGDGGFYVFRVYGTRICSTFLPCAIACEVIPDYRDRIAVVLVKVRAVDMYSYGSQSVHLFGDKHQSREIYLVNFFFIMLSRNVLKKSKKRSKTCLPGNSYFNFICFLKEIRC